MEPEIPLTIQAGQSKRSNKLRKPEPEDWQRWQLRIMPRYKISPAGVFVDEMRAEGLGVTVKMLHDRYRQWGINDKNRRSTPKKVCNSTVAAATHNDALCCHHDERFGGGLRQNVSNDNVNLQPSFYIPNLPRLLHQALKSVHDWQSHSNELGGRREAAMWASIWLRTHLRETDWAVHCLENEPSRELSELAFERLRKAGITIHDNLEVKCSPPAVLMSMTALLKFGTPDNRPSSIYSYTAKRFFLGVAAEILPVSHPTLLLLQLLLCEQSPEALPAVCRAGGSVIGHYIGINSKDIWTSQIELSHAVTMSDTNPEPETCLGSADAERSTATGKDAAATRGRRYVYRLHSLSTLRAQHRDDLRKAYGAYQLLFISHKWLNDSVGEDVSLRNTLQLAHLMHSDADGQSGDLSFELLQAIRDLYFYYEGQGNAERCRNLRLEYPAFFQQCDSEA
ncbi:hypothetical protein MBLNU13_g06416t1 [Cladosporium sp. NU13]